MLVDNAHDAAVDDKARANGAGLVRAVKGCAVHRDAEFCRLNDCVLLCMDGIAFFCASAALYAKPIAHAISFVTAVEYACGRAVVARGENAFVLDDDRADRAALPCATCPGGNQFRHVHKSFVPVVHTLSFARIYFYINDISTKIYNIQRQLLKIGIIFFKKPCIIY